MPGRVLVVDDDPSFRAVASALLRARGYEVVAEAGTASEAVAAAEALAPAAVLLDVHLPDGDGIALTTELRSATPGLRVLLISADAGAVPDDIRRSCGAVGFIPKAELATTELGVLLDQ